MLARLFDIENGKVIPSEHCYTLKFLKKIMDEYKKDEEYLKVYQYLFYMTYPNPDMNPYFHIMEIEKEDMILEDIEADFSPEDPLIIGSLEKCKKLYETPASRAYEGIAGMLDKLAHHMKHTTITSGKDSNITQIVSAAAKFEQVRQSYKGAYKDLKDEQQIHTRGGKNTAYDQ